MQYILAAIAAAFTLFVIYIVFAPVFAQLLGTLNALGM
jgi:hypothetical protein